MKSAMGFRKSASEPLCLSGAAQAAREMHGQNDKAPNQSEHCADCDAGDAEGQQQHPD